MTKINYDRIFYCDNTQVIFSKYLSVIMYKNVIFNKILKCNYFIFQYSVTFFDKGSKKKFEN